MTFDIGEAYKFCNVYGNMILYPGELFDTIHDDLSINSGRFIYERKGKTWNGTFDFIFTVLDRKEISGYIVAKITGNGEIYTIFHEIILDKHHLKYFQHLNEIQ